MAYTIIRSDGTVLTTIQDGTIDTISTSLGLPGRNKAGYGQTLDTNMVRLLENFSNDSPPAHPLKGQLWYDTSSAPAVLRVCPADNTTVASSWPVLASTSTTGNTVVPNLIATENIIGNNCSITNAISGDSITVSNATVSTKLIAVLGNITTANIGTTRTSTITTGGTSTGGSITGQWVAYGAGNSIYVNSGNLAFGVSSLNGIKCDNYMNTDGTPFTPTGTYTNANVSAYLTDSSIAGFKGDIFPDSVTTSLLAGGGNISGIWTLAANARIEATYADLAERYEADAIYEPGTVVEIGGEKEITCVKDDASEEVFGVISNTAAYLMNGPAGTDQTHPAVALAGRLHVKVIGQICKGQRLVAAGNGLARGASKDELTPFNVIGRALAHKTDDGVGVIEAVVRIN